MMMMMILVAEAGNLFKYGQNNWRCTMPHCTSVRNVAGFNSSDTFIVMIPIRLCSKWLFSMANEYI